MMKKPFASYSKWAREALMRHGLSYEIWKTATSDLRGESGPRMTAWIELFEKCLDAMWKYAAEMDEKNGSGAWHTRREEAA